MNEDDFRKQIAELLEEIEKLKSENNSLTTVIDKKDSALKSIFDEATWAWKIS